MKVMFIGGPGNISTSTAEDILDRGDALGIYTLPGVVEGEFKGKVAFYFGDRNNPNDLGAAIHHFQPDVLVDFCCFTLTQAGQLYPLIKGKLKQFIFISTVDVYGFPLSRIPMREKDNRKPTNCEYAENKRQIEEFYQLRSGIDFPLTIVRPVYSMGNTFAISCLSRGGGRHLVPWLRVGKPVLSCGDGTTLLHTSAAVNTGRMIARITGTAFAIGKSYTCGHEYAITHDDYINLFAKALNVDPNIVHVPSSLILKKLNPKPEGFILDVLTAFNVSFSVEKFKADFPDFEWRVSLEMAVKDYIGYNDELNNWADPNETILEDVIIESFSNAVSKFQLPASGFKPY